MPWHQGCLLVLSKCVYACMYVYICACVCVWCVCLCVKVSYIRPKIRNQITKPKYIQIHRHSLKSWHRNVGHAVAKWFVLLPNTTTSTKKCATLLGRIINGKIGLYVLFIFTREETSYNSCTGKTLNPSPPFLWIYATKTFLSVHIFSRRFQDSTHPSPYPRFEV